MGDFKPQKLLNKAVALHQAGKLAEADALYKKILDAQPDNPDALHMSGVIAQQTGKHQKAVTLISRARKSYPAMPELHNNLGLALESSGRSDEAEVSYRTAIGLRPSYADAHQNYATLLLKRGDLDAATHHISHALRLKPGDPSYLNTLGNILQQRRQHAEAIACYQRALSVLPGYSMAIVNMGNAFRSLKQWEDAAACYRNAIATNPRESAACLYLGSTLEKLGKREEAMAAYEEALRRRPGWADAQFFLQALKSSEGGAVPVTAPQGYVAQLFDSYAGTFDQHLTEKLQYRAPQLLFEAVRPQLPAAKAGEAAQLDVMDLGCGTGLLGPLVRPVARRLCGVDLSEKMLEQAKRRGLYDELICGDLVATLSPLSAAYDMLLAADVLVYIGDLEPLFRTAAGALRPGGLLAFTVEANFEDGSIRLLPSRRYAHAEAYLRGLAAAHGFEALSLTTDVLRKQSEEDIKGHIVVLRKPGQAAS
jgi:predicted TPR repeat methyltransferase